MNEPDPAVVLIVARAIVAFACVVAIIGGALLATLI